MGPKHWIARALSRLSPRSSGKANISLAICAQFRDEAVFLDEWLTFHISQGVQHFYLFDHQSSDHFRQVLKPWRRAGIVSLGRVGNRTQEKLNTDCVRRVRGKVSWLAFIDIDEFLYSPTGTPLPETLETFAESAGVFVFWKLFGSEGKEGPGARGVLETFTRGLGTPVDSRGAKAQLSNWETIRGQSLLTGSPIQGKSVVRPDHIREMGVHCPVQWSGHVVDERGNPVLGEINVKSRYTSTLKPTREILAINHYWSRGTRNLSPKFAKPGTARIFRSTNHPRPTIKQAEEWDRKILGNPDLDILRLWRKVSAPYVFLIGFNKTATRAFADFFEKNGFPSVHWDNNRLVETMLGNLSAGRRILHGYDESFRFFSDFILFTSEKRVEGNAFFREMDRDYPGSFFILNNRSTEDWLLSRQRHGHGRFLELSFSQLSTSDVEVVRNVWRQEKEAHEKAVREYFEDRFDFLEIDIDSSDVPQRVSSFLGMTLDPSKWRTIGRTVDIGPYEKTRK